MAVEERIKAIIAEQLGVKPEEVTPEASFIDDLGADSLDTVELIMRSKRNSALRFRMKMPRK